MNKKGIIALQDGSYFEGISFGAKAETQGEVCFNTSMTGYQEILTDPSYCNQIITMTYPEIGNYGVTSEDEESSKIWAKGFIVKNYCDFPSNWRSNTYLSENHENSLGSYLEKNNIPAIQNIDTRELTLILREKGAQNGIIATNDYDKKDVISRAKNVPSLTGKNLAKVVTTSKIYTWDQKEHSILQNTHVKPLGLNVVVIDFGVKYNILRKLTSLGLSVTVVPADTSSQDILKLNPDGILLSNGPGDPEPLKKEIQTVRELLDKKPIFGICLGHQILSLALNAKTYKLKFGHRGANHPIKNLEDGSIAISSQNHGFAVDSNSIDQSIIEITHLNLNDQTIAGIKHKQYPAFSVQYHPEASPGPQDSHHLFKHFVQNIQSSKV